MTDSHTPSRHIALVPAAGSGSRFGAETPKQYLPLLGRPLIWHTLAVLCDCVQIEQVAVVISAQDEWWEAYDWSDLGHKLTVLRCGGATRAESVRNGLDTLALQPEDWVLVHDAARPCLSPEMIADLLLELCDDPVGGILATPVADTIKRADPAQRVAETVSRDGLWQAQTPQMFRYARLHQALHDFPDVTDEAGAIEAAGCKPRLVKGGPTNLKVTYPADLDLAAWILRGRHQL
jgi:2-C-methyl-D-erythritol 4-phosphate cytidylyltransferase